MTSFLNWLSQITTITLFNLRTLPQRLASSLTSAFGIAGVVGVLVGVLAIAEGLRSALTASGSEDVAVVLRNGADSELSSNLSRDNAQVIADAPGIARGTSGALASAELFVVINLPKRTTGTDANVPLRGVQPAGFEVRDGIHLVEGRQFKQGQNEIIVGTGAARAFAGLNVGNEITVGRNVWKVVGIFTAKGGASESEIWTDAKVLAPAYNREDGYQSVSVRLASAGAFQEFKDAMTSDPKLNVKVLRQTEFFEEQSKAVTSFITRIGTVIAGMMALGALFGALNTMYSAVASRTREIATLRALGFGSSPVIISVMVESILLSLAGGLAGALAAYFLFNGYQSSTMNWQTFSQVAFSFKVTAGLLVSAIFFAAILGLLGGLFPAIRAARLPIATGLRES